MSLQSVHQYIDEHFAEHLAITQEFLRIRSTAAGPGLSDAARWVAAQVHSLGGASEFAGPDNAPMVYGRLDGHRPKTLLIYGMYDVQPVEGQNWNSPPFAAVVRDLPGIGASIVARGACNSKGPLAGFLNAVRSILAVDELPVNLVLTIEGEEELGSQSLPKFYRENKHRLRADAAFEPFWAEYGTDVDRPTIALGTKGVTSCEVVCRGGSWGGPTRHPVHSSVGAWIASPAWRLLRALSTLLDDRENITIADFQSQVVAPSRSDEVLLSNLRNTFDERKALEIAGARKFKYDLHGVDLLRQYLFSPTLQVVPLSQGEGDVIPPEARAHLIVRLVPDMDPVQTIERIKRHFDSHGYGDFEVNQLSGYPASRTDLNEDVVQSLIASYRYHGADPQIWPMLASATPYYLFSHVLGIPYAWGGLGRAGGSHSIDEFASVDGLKLFEKSVATFLYEFGRDS
jgi:acetylornithine deacetylase/succinyl-diaminopimelate desuccinylase-like protein